MAMSWFTDFLSSQNDTQYESECRPTTYGAVSDGTTLVAAEYDGGVVIGVDSRTSSGSIIVSRVTDKITPMLNNIVCLRSGNAAHSQAIADAVRTRLRLFEVEEEGRPVRVEVAAQCIRDIMYRYRDDLSASFIVAGWDNVDGGQIYQVPSGGMIVRQPLCCSGSGTTYVYGFVDSSYKPMMKMTECKEFVKKAVALAISRDGGSGGVIRLATISKGGIEQELIAGEKLPRFEL